VEKTGAVPLRLVVENTQYKLESTAIEVAPLKLDTTFFEVKRSLRRSQWLTKHYFVIGNLEIKIQEASRFTFI